MVDCPLRIGFVDYVLEPEKPGRSGLSDVVWGMATELVNQGHEAHIVASYHTTEYPDDRVTVHNFSTPPLGYRNILGNFWLLRRAARVLERIQPNIIHAPEYVSTAVFAALGVKVPLVLTVPGNIFCRLEQGHNYEWHFVQVLKWAARMSARDCSSIIATSKEMKYWWERTGSSPERTPWISYGIDVNRFHPVQDARPKLGLDRDKLTLLYVGRFALEKGIPDLLGALVKLRSLLEAGGVEVILIGDGPQKAEIEHKIGSLQLQNVVTTLPWVHQDTLPLWYSAADVLIMPSWNEPLGKVMLEAMACGTPVIASDSEGPRDHIINGKNGFLFSRRNVEELAGILSDCIKNPQVLKQMREYSQKYISDNLTWSAIVSRVTEEVYYPVVSNSHKDNKRQLQKSGS